MARFFNGVFHQRVPAIGHANALSYPDRPYLRWSYINGAGKHVVRDNAQEFLEAANELCRWVGRYLHRDADAETPGLPPLIANRIHGLFTSLVDGKPERRHQRWLAALAEDAFGIGSVHLSYQPKGFGSWKHLALGTTAAKDPKSARFKYRPGFLRSNYKLFHDAAKVHRLSVVDDILPNYEICVA